MVNFEEEPLLNIDIKDLLFFEKDTTVLRLEDYLNNPPEIAPFELNNISKIVTVNTESKSEKEKTKKTYKRLKNKLCKICDRAFTTTTKLNIHILVHSGSRPFKCKQCEKTFSQEFNLKRHEMVHQPQRQRKFQCHVCGLFYWEKHHLTDHILSCHSFSQDEKKIVCDICKKIVKNKNSYRMHRYRHVTFMENEI